MEKQIRLLIVDDSYLYRKILKDILQEIPGVQVVGQARDGKDAIEQVARLKPDMITLDVEMPVMDGIDTLETLKKSYRDIAVVMVSAVTTAGAKITVKALELGALDFITKPDSKDQEKNKKHILNQFKPILNIFQIKSRAQRMAAGTAQRSAEATAASQKQAAPQHPAPQADRAGPAPMDNGPVRGPGLRGRPDILAIGISTGGPKALMEVIPNLPANFPVPVIIIQHMPAVFTQALADSLNKRSQLKIREAVDGDIMSSGNVYIAPGGKHMRLKGANSTRRMVIEITDDPPLNHCKPSVDYCFKSVSKFYPGKVLAVIMTGMGNDGTLGLRLLKRSGAEVIAQDQESSVVFGMPAEAIKANVVDYILPLNRIADKIREIVH